MVAAAVEVMPTMPTTPARPPAKQPKPKRQTWQDWAPDAPAPETLLTREEVLARVAAEGAPVSGNQLRYLQRLELIPYPIRRRRGQAVRGFYPPWVVDLVRMVHDHRRHTTDPGTLALQQARMQRQARDFAQHGGHYAGIVCGVMYPPDLQARLEAIAREWEPIVGMPVTDVELRLNGTLVFGAPIPGAE